MLLPIYTEEKKDYILCLRFRQRLWVGDCCGCDNHAGIQGIDHKVCCTYKTLLETVVPVPMKLVRSSTKSRLPVLALLCPLTGTLEDIAKCCKCECYRGWGFESVFCAYGGIKYGSSKTMV